MGFVLTTPPDNVALSIALGIIFLTTVVEPVVKMCFHRVRAERAWRTIEKQEPVEVTKYPVISEALGDRGRWDAARLVTYLLFGFHIATTALELSLDLAVRTDGPVDLLNRPPPVLYRTELVDPEHNFTDWKISLGANEDDVKEEGALGNFKGSLEHGTASNTYRIGNKIVRGKTLFASWSNQFALASPGLFYNTNEGRALVEGIACTALLRTASVYVMRDGSDSPGGEKWGVVMECESGPMPVNSTVDDIANPPAIIMSSSGGEAHYVIVEEDSSYPNFMYSVWRAASTVELEHMFFISTNSRMVEAIVTGIANGILNGGGCVDLLAQYSVSNSAYTVVGTSRVSPFGEHPNASSVESLDQVEPIVAGVLVNNLGVFCGVLILAVTVTAMVGGFCFRSRRSLDIYDRDELIRAVSLPDGEGVGVNGKPKALKLFVHRSDAKGFSIIISDDGVYRGGCSGMAKHVMDKLKRLKRPPTASTLNAGVAVAESHENFSAGGKGFDSRISAGSRSIAFDGVHPVEGGESFTHNSESTPATPHTGEGDRVLNSRPTPATPHNGEGDRVLGSRPTVVELIASPVPQHGGGGNISRRTVGMLGLRLESCRSLRVIAAEGDAEMPVAPTE